MRRIYLLLAVCLLLGGTLAFSGEKIKPDFDEITLNGERITSWDNIAGYGWFGESVASKIGVPYFNNGAVTWDSLVEFLARAGVTYNPATDSWEFSAEIVSPQFGSNAADGEHFINVANSTAPTDNVAVGDCYYDNVALRWLCWNGSAWAGATGDVTGSSTTTFTNKTLDAAGSGNVLKQTKYLYLDTPSWASGTAAEFDNTYHDVTFSNSADKANNCAVYATTVPDDLDNTVAVSARFKYELLGADTATHQYVILMKSVANSASVTGAYGSLGNEIAFDANSDASGANADLETVGWKTLTGWATAVTPGHLWVISVCRDGDSASDASTVDSFSHSLTIRYGSVQ